MAMGIFDQLDWLTKKVKKLCCIAENNQSIQTITLPNPSVDPIPQPTTITSRYMVYDIPGSFGQVLDLYLVPGKEGQVVTVCLQPHDPPNSSLAIRYSINGTQTWTIDDTGNSCMTFYYIGGVWIIEFSP